MSMTLGPMAPSNTGKSRVFPSGSLSEAILSAMVCFLGCAKSRDEVVQVGLVGIAAAHHDVQQVVVGQLEKLIERIRFPLLQGVSLHESFQDDIKLQQAAPALPVQLALAVVVHHTERFTINSLMLLMAFVGLR